MPGTGHLDLMLAAVRLAGLDGFALRDVMLVEPLVVPDDLPVTVRVTVDPKGPHGTHAVLVESDRGYGKAWHLHSQAAAGPPLDTASRSASRRGARHADRPAGRAEATARSSARTGTPSTTPARTGRRRWPAWRSIRPTRRRPRPGSPTRRCSTWRRPWRCRCGPTTGSDAVMVPVGYEAVTLTAPLPAEVDVVARRRADSTADVLIADLTIADTTGRAGPRHRGADAARGGRHGQLRSARRHRHRHSAAGRRLVRRARRASRHP